MLVKYSRIPSLKKSCQHCHLLSNSTCSNYNSFSYKQLNFFSSTFAGMTLYYSGHSRKLIPRTVWKVSKYGVFSGPNTGKYGLEKTPYLDTLHAILWLLLAFEDSVYSAVLSKLFRGESRTHSKIYDGAFPAK